MDCLADTGLPLGGILALATLGVIAGLAAVIFLRGKRRRGSAALGIILVLVGAGFWNGAQSPNAHAASHTSCVAAGTATTDDGDASGTGATSFTPGSTTTGAPGPVTTVTTTVTAVPTPTRTPDGPITTTPPPDSPTIDLTPTSSVAPPSVPSNVSTPVAVSVVVNNPLAAPSSGPVTLKIPKLAGPEAGGLLVSGLNWTVDDVSDPSNHVLTYGLAIPGFGHSSTLVMGYLGWKVRDELAVPATIVTGSAGDTNPLNNSTSVTVRIN